MPGTVVGLVALALVVAVARHRARPAEALPVPLVAAHVVTAALTVAAGTHLVVRTYRS